MLWSTASRSTTRAGVSRVGSLGARAVRRVWVTVVINVRSIRRSRCPLRDSRRNGLLAGDFLGHVCRCNGVALLQKVFAPLVCWGGGRLPRWVARFSHDGQVKTSAFLGHVFGHDAQGVCSQAGAHVFRVAVWLQHPARRCTAMCGCVRDNLRDGACAHAGQHHAARGRQLWEGSEAIAEEQLDACAQVRLRQGQSRALKRPVRALHGGDAGHTVVLKQRLTKMPVIAANIDKVPALRNGLGHHLQPRRERACTTAGHATLLSRRPAATRRHTAAQTM